VQQQWLDDAQKACVRTDKENSDIAYARRLKERDRRLNNKALAKGSGATVVKIQQAAKKWSMG
jgi:hypothetical protein